jgi:hypothetical protein
MKAKQAVAIFSLACVPLLLLAKGPTFKITIEGPELSSPVEISDELVLGKFNVWAGAGTTPQTEGFIVDWGKGPVGGEQAVLTSPRYKVSFHVIHQDRPISYVVFYAFDPATGKGYVYLPGKGETYWGSNVYLIWRGVEGKWLNASGAWTDFARPAIERARAEGRAPR